MKKVFFILLTVLPFFVTQSCAQKAKPIKIAPKAQVATNLMLNQEIESSLQDAQSLLHKAGLYVQFNLKKSEQLNRNSSNFIISTSKNYVEIKGSENPNSYINGIYYYLEAIGFRFLNYSDNWIVYPEEITQLNLSNKHIIRSVENLGFFGTGGLGKDKETAVLVEQYKKRNGYTANISGVPHMFEYFYKKNKEYIDKHPNILADYKTRKKDPNLDHPLTMPLIKQWIQREVEQNPDRYKYHISVSPADGLSSNNTTLPKRIPSIKTINDKNIWIANEVAKHLEKELPWWKGYVSYNVYGNGVGSVTPPTFELHPKIWLQFFPYAFQRDYKTDQEFFNAWNVKHNNQAKSVSDYWSITQWTEGLPKSDLYSITQTRLPIWKKEGFKGIKFETTYFGAVTGPHFWVTSQYLKGYNNLTIEELYSQYYSLAFGYGANDIEKMYKRWSNNFIGESEIPLALRDLNNAYNKAIKAEEKNRIIELMAYVQWMRLHYECKKKPTTSNALKLERYAKKIRSLAMTQSYTVWRYNYGNVKPYKFGGSPDKWNDYLTNSSFNQLKQDILYDFKQNLNDYPVNFNTSNFNHKKVAQIIPTSFKEVTETTYLSKEHTYSFTPIDNDIYTFKWINDNKNDHIIINKGLNDEKVITTRQVKTTNEFQLNVTKGKQYTISFVPEKTSKIRYTLPNKTNFIYLEGRFASSNARNTWYIYVPNDIDEILVKPFSKDGYTTTPGKTSALLKPTKNGYEIVMPKPTTKKFEGTYIIPVSKEDRGKTWKIIMRVDKWEILNFEPIISKTEFKIIQ